MIPTLRHIPARAVTRIPGPPRIGSRKAVATLGAYHFDVGAQAGFPTGDMIRNYATASPSGQAPTWFAVSDGGAGYIPWGSWQVAVYVTGSDYPPSTNFAFRWTTADPGEAAAAIAARVDTEFNTLRSQAISAGYGAASEIQILDDYVGLGGPTPSGRVRIVAPYGVPLTAFYEGSYYLDPSSEQPLSMIQVEQGYDNPMFLALWSPGNRAAFHAQLSGGPRRYPGYPYPYPPYVGPPPG